MLNSNSSELTGVKNKGIKKNVKGNRKEINFLRKVSSFILLFKVYQKRSEVFVLKYF